MREKNGFVEKFVPGVIRFLLPIALILSSVWIILQTAKLWVQLEYRSPGFPEDRYGFMLEDRLYWSKVDIDYLLNDAGIEYFNAFQLDDGSPMHNARELRHMEDVKDLIGITWWVLGLSWLVLILSAVVLSSRQSWTQVVEVTSAGARSTLWLMVVLVVGLVIGFGVLFVGFHRIFFEGDSWLFSYSDTFIRLYPERFWRDTFALVAIVTLSLALLLIWLPKRIIKPSG
jgi:integral membrane protein (TIGR01906 family)